MNDIRDNSGGEDPFSVHQPLPTPESLTPPQVEGMVQFIRDLGKRIIDVQAQLDPFAHAAAKTALESGQTLDPETLEALLGAEKTLGAYDELKTVIQGINRALES